MSMRGAMIFAAAAAALACSAATAQGSSDSIIGSWKFATEEFDVGCKMTGSVSFKSDAASGAFSCSMAVEAVCNLNGQVWQTWRVIETCSAMKQGAQVKTIATIERIESATLFNKPATPARRALYTNDNLDLKVTTPGVEMKGLIVGGRTPVPIRLWRDADLVG